MPPKSSTEIRKAYLEFFEGKNHAVVPGAPLVPENDPTVLFTTAGMHPLVPYLLGEPHPSGNRITDVQRCIRTQDIDEVGDASHLTFFEMMGNWSLGDYFKEEAIKMSYEFLTEILEIPKEKLAVTCFEGDSDAPKDEEAAKVWMEVGMPKERIGFLPKADNWWGPAGQTGPCGPDTEMFYWVGKGDPTGNPETHPKDWLEIWNDVFMQYSREESKDSKEPKDGKEYCFEVLSQKNVDTGMGLERTAQVMQGVDSVYEIDTMKPILDKVLSIASSNDDSHSRIIVDHIRSAVFIIADGIKPSNVDQGYVLRRLIRRAIRSGKQLGIEKSFCSEIAKVVIDQFGDFYSHIDKNKKEILNALQSEEEQFSKTLKDGMKQFDKVIEGISNNTIDGKSAFHLYDTYGFPLELTKEMATEKNIKVDEKGFSKAFEAHQELSRAGASGRFSGGLADNSAETTKLHTATHLLNVALRKVLGDHIMQKGSNITQERLRFDFNHDEKVTKEELAEVEQLVNEAIQKDLPISYHVTTAQKAKEENAIGVFDDRYGSEVKVYEIGSGNENFSKEICGGPHVARTSMIGSFKIKKEESSSAGVRRIKAMIADGPESVELAFEE
jgi:alanyl-tRNA synthetase